MATTLRTLPHDQIQEDTWRTLRNTSPQYVVAVLLTGSVTAWGLICWAYQISKGLGVVGKTRPTMWALYILNFVFWIGISHAGTLISAILRLTHAAWRKPVTRAAEAITVFCLMIGGLFPIIHLGRPWLFYWLIPYPNSRLIWPNFRSPLLWDLTAILTYLTGSMLFLYLPMIPDLGQLGLHTSGARGLLYRTLSLGWTGSDREWHALEKAMKLMAGMILAVAVSVHTVVAWDFAMALAPMWHSTIFGPYFVVGAIFSGIAALLLIMAVIRKTMGLQAYLQPRHFENLAKLLFLMSLLWAYFTVAENLTVWYGNQPHEMAVFGARVRGRYAPFFWSMVICNFIVPCLLVGIRRLRSIKTAVISAVCVLAGMWLERFLIVIPTLSFPPLPSAWGTGYNATWVEISIAISTFAAMALLYLIFAKLFPIIAIWEYKYVPDE